MIIQSSPLGNILRLKRDLKTTASHPETHCVHVYVVFFGRCLGINVLGIESAGEGDGRIVEGTGGVCVVEDGDVDSDFAATTGSDVGCQGTETGVSVYYFVGDEERAGCWAGRCGGGISEVFAT